MRNIAIPGVFPLVIALFMAYGFLRSTAILKRSGDRKAKAGRTLCLVGTVLFLLLALLQLLESFGISFR